MKKTIIILIVALLAISAFYGCASGSMDNRSPAATTTAGYNPGGAKENDNAPGGDTQIERKIIRNASLDLEATDVVTAYESLLAWAAQYGGYETRRNQQRVNDIISIDAQIKIKPEYLDALLDYAKTLGDVINTQISTEDITDSYYDIQTRLKSMELSLESYYGYLAKAKTIDESLSVQSQINNLTVEIESLKGRLKLWDSLLAESVVTIRLRQTNDPIKIKKDIDWSTLSFADMGYLMKSGLASVANILVNILQWLAIVVVAASPLWIIAIIVIIVVRRKKKKRQQQAARQQQVDKPSGQPPAAPDMTRHD
jgi:preprotein translocase subunit SecG